MPTGLTKLYDVNEHERAQDRVVDIVAVHGINGDSIETWTDPLSRILWLRDLLPRKLQAARIFTYGYNAPVSEFFDRGCSKAIQEYARRLVYDLQDERSFDEPPTSRRPIVFVCHGLGGVVVKKALVYSQAQTSHHVAHLYDIFVSTYAILFFSTPHDGGNRSNWLAIESLTVSENSTILENSTLDQAISNEDAECIRIITEEFTPIMRQFRMYFFWEQIMTQIGDHQAFMVEPSSAAPALGTEKCGIEADHFGMVRISETGSSRYKTVIGAMKRYCEKAPEMISLRWKQAESFLNQLRSNEAFELIGLAFDLHSGDAIPEYRGANKLRNKHFYPPQDLTLSFVGREDVIQKIEHAFFHVRHTTSNDLSGQQKRFVIHGMGGSGKTQVCSKFATRFQERYWAVFTIHASTAETIRDSFRKIGKIGGLEATEDSGQYFLSQEDKSILVIIDNADDPRMNLQHCFPQSRQAHVLVTTRNPDFRQNATVGSEELKGLREEEALHLLLFRAEIARPWDTATESAGNQITKALGYLALALIQAGSCIFRKICSLTEYLPLHAASRKARQHSRGAMPDEDEIVTTVYSTFDVSLDYLRKQVSGSSKDALDILNILAFFDPERIRVDIFTRAATNRINAFQSSVPNTLWSKWEAKIVRRLQPPLILPDFLRGETAPLRMDRVKRAIAVLRSHSLISYSSKDSSFSLHPLVHTWARDRLSDGEKGLWAGVALNTIVAAVQLPPDDVGEIHAEFRRDLKPHLQVCLEECDVSLPDFGRLFTRVQVAFASILQPTKLLLLRDQTLKVAKLGYVYAEMGKFERGAEYLAAVKDTLVHTLGYRNDKTMNAMMGLAGTYWGLGRLNEAIPLQKNVVELRSKVYGPTHRQTLIAMNKLGHSYWLNGQYHESLSQLQLTTERMRAVLGQDDEDYLSALDDYGVTLGSWHRFEESKRVHELVLKWRKQKLGPKHEDTLTTMNNLSMALLDLGRSDEARDMMMFVYEERKQLLGKEHPWTLWALCNLSKANIEMGRLDEAKEYLDEGIRAGERSLGKGHLGVLMGYGELARIYARRGNLEQAEALSLETIKLVEKHRGQSHPDCIYGLWKLAQLYELRGDMERGAEICEKALKRVDMGLTRTHPLGQKLEALNVKLRTQAIPREEATQGGEGTQIIQEQRPTPLRFRKRLQQTW